MAVAQIMGITAQEGLHLAKFLSSSGYEVQCVVRQTSSLSRSRIDHLRHGSPALWGPLRPRLYHGDLNDAGSLRRLVRAIKPAEVYNLAAQSHVGVSLDQTEYTADAHALGTTRPPEALRNVEAALQCHQANTSDLFGATPPFQTDESPFRPRSPYSVAQLYADWMTVNYREADGMFADNAILSHDESPWHRENLLTRSATGSVAASLKAGPKLRPGSLHVRRDRGHAGDYVEAIRLMLQQAAPGDYLIGTGIGRSVQDMVELAFRLVGRGHVVSNLPPVRPTEAPDLAGLRERPSGSWNSIPESHSLQ